MLLKITVTDPVVSARVNSYHSYDLYINNSLMIDFQTINTMPIMQELNIGDRDQFKLVYRMLDKTKTNNLTKIKIERDGEVLLDLNDLLGVADGAILFEFIPVSLSVQGLLDLNVIAGSAAYNESIVNLNINEGNLVKFAELGVDFSTLDNEERKEASKHLIHSVFEAKSIKTFMVEKAFFPIIPSNAKEHLLVINYNNAIEVILDNKINLTTSLYIDMYAEASGNAFNLGTTRFHLAKTDSGYNFSTVNSANVTNTTLYTDGDKMTFNGLLFVFAGGAVLIDFTLAIQELIKSNVITNAVAFNQSVAALKIVEKRAIRFADLGVDFSKLTTNEEKKAISKQIIKTVFEAQPEVKTFMVEKASFPIISSNAKENILVVNHNNAVGDLTLDDKLNTTTSMYVAMENVNESNAFILGNTRFIIAKTASGYNLTINNNTTSYNDDDEVIVNDLLIVFGGLSFSFSEPEPVCYARGTLIGTSRGWVPIENLLMSDKLRTYDRIKENMFRPVHGVPIKTLVRVRDTRFKNRFGDIKFIGNFTVNSMNEKTAPIRITAGALGDSKPERDLLVSPNHSMLIGNRLIFAKFLVNGSTIYQDMSFNNIEYFHILSDDHYIINANGTLSETLGSEEMFIFETHIKEEIEVNSITEVSDLIYKQIT